METSHSFVRRCGRMTASQKKALDTLWEKYGIVPEAQLALQTIFGRTAEKHLEIGFGMGDALIQMAKEHPEHDYVGVDVHSPGIGHLLIEIEKWQLTNVRVLNADAITILQDHLPTYCLDMVYIFFPDPWPKKRHHKRRLIQPQFLALLAQRLKPNGHVQLATDWENYAQHMLQTLDASAEFTNVAGQGQFIPRPESRPLTKFEKRGQKLGHGVWDLIYQKQE